MTLSARILDEYDRCQRRYAFSQKYDSRLISPLGVLYEAVESALVSDDPEETAKHATMEAAASHQLILSDLNSFMTIRHTGFLAGIIALALRERLGPLIRVESTSDWESSLFETESGTRHRIELVSHFDDDRLRSAAHSWRVIGELVALEAPLTLTAVVIGPQRGGRRHSEWSKGLMHPQNRALRFAPRQHKAAGLTAGWTKVWREQESVPTARWLAQMRQDAVLDQLIVSREIMYRETDARMVAAKREMAILAAEMQEAAKQYHPMRRSSCDEFGGCPFQAICYSPNGQRPEDFPGLYSIRASESTPRTGKHSAGARTLHPIHSP